MKSNAARRAFAVLVAAACATASAPSSAAVNLLGTVAAQPRVPARLTACNVAVDGPTFAPTISFAAQPNPVARYTVTLAFFDKTNSRAGQVEVTDHGSDSYLLPSGADSMTCAISRLTLDDGSTYPGTGAGNVNAGGIALGVVGVGALLGIALSSHRGSSAAQTAAPSVAPSASNSPGGGAGSTPTATASAGPSSTPTTSSSSTPTTSASSSSTPMTGPPSATPSPFPTGSPTAAPTLRPQRLDPRSGPQRPGR